MNKSKVAMTAERAEKVRWAIAPYIFVHNFDERIFQGLLEECISRKDIGHNVDVFVVKR